MITTQTFLEARTAEEASEVAEAASDIAKQASKLAQSILKGTQYGHADVYQGISNWDRVEQELRELNACAQLLGLDTTPCPDKPARVQSWLNYSKANGIVQDIAYEATHKTLRDHIMVLCDIVEEEEYETREERVRAALTDIGLGGLAE